MIHAMDELQSPLPRKIMLFEGHLNSISGKSDAFPIAKGLANDSPLYEGGRGLHSHFCNKNRMGEGKTFLKVYSCSKNFWQTFLSQFCKSKIISWD